MQCQFLFSGKNKKKIFIHVFCLYSDLVNKKSEKICRFKGLTTAVQINTFELRIHLIQINYFLPFSQNQNLVPVLRSTQNIFNMNKWLKSGLIVAYHGQDIVIFFFKEFLV